MAASAAATTTAVVLKEAKQSTQLAAGAAAKQSTQLAAGAAAAAGVEVVCAKCECCGLTEECTVVYIDRVRERFGGRWICGLCSEAVKDYGDSGSSEKHDVNDGDGDGDDELDSLKQHMKFCQQFRSSTPPVNPTQDLISAVKNLLRRTLDSPRKRKGSVFPSSSASSVTESD